MQTHTAWRFNITKKSRDNLVELVNLLSKTRVLLQTQDDRDVIDRIQEKITTLGNCIDSMNDCDIATTQDWMESIDNQKYLIKSIKGYKE